MRHFGLVLAAALALAIGLWGYFNLEAVRERRFVGFSGEAARNPLLALERLAQRLGAETKVVRSATDLDDADRGATLVLAANRHGMTPSRTERIVRWVQDGGRLIVEAEPLDKRDALLDALRVIRRRATVANANVQIALPNAQPMTVTMLPMGLTDLQSRPGIKVAHGTGTALLHFSHGRGSVTVLPSFWFMTNAEIDEPDHAAFAWALLGLGAADSSGAARVLIAPRFERPSLFAWLAGEALAAVAAALVLLVLWLVRKARRFGPVLPAREGERRRLLDHLRASGRFEWSARAAPRLLAAAREGCLANIARARPTLAGIPAGERSAQYAQLTGLPEDEVDFALYGEAATPRSFVTAVQTLQAIEEKLARRTAA